jgi:transposase
MGDTRLEPLVLSEDERRTLENWAKRRKTAQGLALRARIVLACADGGPNIAVAARLGVSRPTVTKWRARFLARRLDGLGDEPRPGVPRSISDAKVEEVVVRTLEEVPEGATHWSKRELARKAGISPTSVHRIWRAFGLQPWRTEDFKISPDPLLIDKIRDVAGLYLAPPANAAVFAVDEKPQVQALARTAQVLPMIPGTPERRSHDYTRHGTVDLFAALSTATGKVIGKLSAEVGSEPGSGLAALLGADSGDQQFPDAAAGQDLLQAGRGEGVVGGLGQHWLPSGRRQRLDEPDETARRVEHRPRLRLSMQDPHDKVAGGPRVADQPADSIGDARVGDGPPDRALAEGLLHVDNNKRSCHDTIMRSPPKQP